MLFNSFPFLVVFLPIVWLAYEGLRRFASSAVVTAWLALASIAFYGWWNPSYVPLLILSITFNYIASDLILRHKATSLVTLATSIAINISLLAYFKYTTFIITNVSTLLHLQSPPPDITLPLGISFFTFTQIAFLVDTYKYGISDRNYARYSLFVTYFPHLIAGPIIHHKGMMPQFSQSQRDREISPGFALGISIFVFGLFKKVVVADTLSPFVGNVFNVAEQGARLTLWEAWFGALAYTLQLYFDFSGYSEMAVGLSLLFGVRLPINFNSPYRATGIIDFWRRWHMTLSRFLRDYLYIALGGNRKGPIRRYLNLLITMLLGGLWHGAGWTFVLWGGLHGIFLCINHGWNHLMASAKPSNAPVPLVRRATAAGSTFLAVVCAWVLFRSATMGGAVSVLSAMAGSNGVPVPPALVHLTGQLAPGSWIHFGGLWPNIAPDLRPTALALFVTAMLPIAWFGPSVVEIFAGSRPALDMADVRPTRVQWRPTTLWAILIGIVAAIDIARMMTSGSSEFLYFQF